MRICCLTAIAALCAWFELHGIMKTVRVASIVTLGFLTAGCAGLEFSPTPQPDGLLYYDPSPYLQITRGIDCSVTSSVVTLPGQPRSVAFRSGYGSADLGVNLSGGMITQVNQKTDTKVPETITAMAGLATAVGGLAKTAADIAGAAEAPPAAAKTCRPSVVLYPIVDGIPQRRHPISF
jgi:hypothetical protein